MKLRDTVSSDQLSALQEMAAQVEEGRREKKVIADLESQLGVRAGTMTLGELLTLSELREGQKGQRISRSVARSKGRGKSFSHRIAAANTAPR